MGERFASLEPYETDAGLAFSFAHLLSATQARRAADARETAVRDLLDAVETERVRTGTDRGAARVVSNALLDRQEALAMAELAWIKGFRSALGRIRR